MPQSPVDAPAPAADAPAPAADAPGAAARELRSHGSAGNGAVIVLATLTGAVVLSAVLFLLAGGRFFIVDTPSMGEAAPVGTLVLAAPAPVADIREGDIITFHPPTSPKQVYTHRVQSISADGNILTRGDLNDVGDPWTLAGGDLVGKSVAVIPGLGWLVRALPLLILGISIVWLVTGRFVRAPWRVALRIVGVPLVISVAAVILRPFIGINVLAVGSVEGEAQATVVSTGLLPIRVQADGGAPAELITGQLGHVALPSLAGDGHYQLASALNLSPTGWILVGLVCALPLLWSMAAALTRPAGHPEASP